VSPVRPRDAAEAEAESAAALERARTEGIHCMPIPTPFMVGRVNTYLIEDEPLTLLDTGPNSGKALDELEQALAILGHRVEDLELIVISHQHMDHLGLVEILARRSGAEIAGLDRMAPMLRDYSHAMEREDEFAGALMRRHGIPEDLLVALQSVSRSFRAWGASAEITRPLADGSTLELANRSMRVVHRPGHSPSDTIFHDEDRGLLLAGDHLIEHISSNPLISLPLPDRADSSLDDVPIPVDDRPRTLVTYMESLRATQIMEADVVLSGHGKPVTGHAELIDARFRLHARRAEKIRGLIAERPQTAYDVGQALWGNIAVTQAYLSLSEVLGHVDLLLADGAVREVEENRVIRFEAA
jgi:glyoxylase-like metal-dependent hydrolase (beta-lactamase superfamily II)